MADHWQQLMLKMEDRLKLVNASVAFYKTSEQVLFNACIIYTQTHQLDYNRLLGARYVYNGCKYVTGLQCVGKPGAGVQERRGLVWWR